MSNKQIVRRTGRTINHTAINALAQQIADSFTTFMRTYRPAPEEARYAPTVFTNETFVRVRWAWLVFPLSLLAGGHVFLSATIWQTKQRRVQPWKARRIPLLLASIDDTFTKMGTNHLDSTTGLDDLVGRMKVRLEYGDDGEIAFKIAT